MVELLLKRLLSAPFQEPPRDRLRRLVIRRHLLARASALIAFAVSLAGLILWMVLPQEDMVLREQTLWMIFLGVSTIFWGAMTLHVTFLKLTLSDDSVISHSLFFGEKALGFAWISQIKPATYFFGLNNPLLSLSRKDYRDCIMSMVLIGPNVRIVVPVGTCGFGRFLSELRRRVSSPEFEAIEQNLEKRRRDYLALCGQHQSPRL